MVESHDRGPAQAHQLRIERDFYRQLVALGEEQDIEPFVTAALSLVAKLAGAQRGYLEIVDETAHAEARFTRTYGCSEEDAETFRASISRGVIEATLSDEETVISAAALDDARFGDRGSVRRNKIQAVLCAPVLAGAHRGVIYLQGRDATGPFSVSDRRRVETFAHHIAALAERLFLRRRAAEEFDHTARFRALLDADDIVGKSHAIAKVLDLITLTAPIDVSVLLTGPTGSGKTLLARVLHRNSRRRASPFVELNCAAIPEQLIESELFGAHAGAHSTAHRAAEGKIAAAEHGTLFLDEIGELSLAVQAKLLQLLQDKVYYPLGSSRPVHADVRIVAATNRDLQADVEAKRFRADLYYRLNVLPIRSPALAERPEDIPALLRSVCDRVCRRYGFAALDLAPSALSAAETNEWPGNVRQLVHTIEAAAIRANGEGVTHVEVRHLFPAPPGDAESWSFQESTRRFQRRLVEQCLTKTNWNVSEAARQLDLTRQYVHKLITSFGLKRT